MISEDRLLAGHALSRIHQPNIKVLVEAVRSPGPIVIVMGAGVSIDSGLPSWDRLLSNLIGFVEHSAFQKLLSQDQSGSLRKAEYIRAMLARHPSDSYHTLLSKALYSSYTGSTGELAAAVARFVLVNRVRFRLLTTNFDNVIENALNSLVPPGEPSFEAVSVTQDNPPSLESNRVYHLHGYLYPKNDPAPTSPLVLTEEEFLRWGPRVRDYLKTSFEGASCVVFVGMSMVDPNIVGPLWDIKNGDSGSAGLQNSDDGNRQKLGQQLANIPKFVLATVSETDGSSAVDYETLVRYTRARAEYLEQSLGAKVILTKSYGQLTQLLCELGLDLAESQIYGARNANKVRYGPRLQRALNQAYETIGAAKSRDIPTDQVKRDNLTEHLWRIAGSFEKEAARCSREFLNGSASIEEKIAVFLWLRERSHGKRSAPYAIRLIGSSAYTNRDSWLQEDMYEKIDCRSQTSAGRAIASGSYHMQNMYPNPPRRRTWRGVVGLPIRVLASGSGLTVIDSTRISGVRGELDQLTIGAVTINSTMPVTKERSSDDISVFTRLQEAGHLETLLDWLNGRVCDYLMPIIK